MKENRKRNKTLTIRLTETEKEMLVRNAKRTCKSLTDYIVYLSLESTTKSTNEIKPLIIEFKRLVDQLNSINEKLESGDLHSFNFQDVFDEQKIIYKQLFELIRKRTLTVTQEIIQKNLNNEK